MVQFGLGTPSTLAIFCPPPVNVVCIVVGQRYPRQLANKVSWNKAVGDTCPMAIILYQTVKRRGVDPVSRHSSPMVFLAFVDHAFVDLMSRSDLHSFF